MFKSNCDKYYICCYAATAIVRLYLIMLMLKVKFTCICRHLAIADADFCFEMLWKFIRTLHFSGICLQTVININKNKI